MKGFYFKNASGQILMYLKYGTRRAAIKSFETDYNVCFKSLESAGKIILEIVK